MTPPLSLTATIGRTSHVVASGVKVKNKEGCEPHPIPEGQLPDYFAMWSQLLSRVPCIGEVLGLPGQKKGTIDSVLWIEDGRPMVTLANAVVQLDYLDVLRAAGWHVSPREDPDDWLRAILESEN